MKTGIIILCMAAFCSFRQAGTPIDILTLTQLQDQTLGKNNDTLYVVNYWATWCMPCVHEMPFFEEAAKTFAAKKVKVLYVSLNAEKEYQQVVKFTQAHHILNRVVLLNAGNPNVWIDQVEPSWGGSIPATLMYKKGKKVFFKEGSFTQEEIIASINDKNK
jgi:thiol-disulfide isomerase/thioredoxin